MDLKINFVDVPDTSCLLFTFLNLDTNNILDADEFSFTHVINTHSGTYPAENTLLPKVAKHLTMSVCPPILHSEHRNIILIKHAALYHEMLAHIIHT